MARLDRTTPDVILLRVQARLIDQITEANEANTWISTLPERASPPPSVGDFMYEISMTGGDFDPAHFAGGGSNTLDLTCNVIVSIHSITSIDETSRDTLFLTDSTLGILSRSTSVIKALSAHDLQNASAQEVLRHPMQPASFVIPPRLEMSSGYVSTSFLVTFFWDVS